MGPVKPGNRLFFIYIFYTFETEMKGSGVGGEKKKERKDKRKRKKYSHKILPRQGIEPWIFGLRDRRLTTWPPRLLSNRRNLINIISTSRLLFQTFTYCEAVSNKSNDVILLK